MERNWTGSRVNWSQRTLEIAKSKEAAPKAPSVAVVATSREPGTVVTWTPIYVVSKEWTTWQWLCDQHAVAKRAEGWTVKEIGERPGSLAPHPCQACPRAGGQYRDQEGTNV